MWTQSGHDTVCHVQSTEKGIEGMAMLSYILLCFEVFHGVDVRTQSQVLGAWGFWSRGVKMGIGSGLINRSSMEGKGEGKTVGKNGRPNEKPRVAMTAQ